MEPRHENGYSNGNGGLPRELLSALRHMPVPPPRLAFSTRVFATLPRQARMPTQPMTWAVAATFAAAVGMTVWLVQAPEPKARPVVASPLQSEIVALEAGRPGSLRLAFRSPRELTGVTIHLQLPEGVELEGHPGRHSLRWTTDLQAGANVLELPLVMRAGDGGLLTATLDHHGRQKAFTVQVRASRSAVLYPNPPATQSAVAAQNST